MKADSIHGHQHVFRALGNRRKLAPVHVALTFSIQYQLCNWYFTRRPTENVSLGSTHAWLATSTFVDLYHSTQQYIIGHHLNVLFEGLDCFKQIPLPLLQGRHIFLLVFHLPEDVSKKNKVQRSDRYSERRGS